MPPQSRLRDHNQRIDSPSTATACRLVLAHGAGAGMTSAFMDRFCAELAATNLAVSRFEFNYMAEARLSGKRRPPPRVASLQPEYVAMLESVASDFPGDTLFVGGKSMGGRIASLVSEQLFRQGRIAGLICLGYPFHPAGRPDTLRTAHLLELSLPTLIVQGTRDPLGSQSDVAGYDISPNVKMCWLDDGDHDFKPRRASGWTTAQHIATAAAAVAAFCHTVKAAR